MFRNIFLFVFSFFIINSPSLFSDWVFDNSIAVNNKRSKVIKFENNYYVLNNIDSTMYLYHYSNKKVDTIIVDPKFNDYFLGFDVDSRYIAFNGLKYLYIVNNNGDKLYWKIPYKNKPFRNIEFINKKLVTYSADLSEISCNYLTKTLVNIIPDFSGENQKIYTFSDPAGIDLTSFVPSKVISLINNLIAVQDVSNYKIKFYDKEYNYVDSINYKPSNWKQFEGQIPHYNCDPEIMLHINKCYYIIDNYSKINLINTLNDSTILISWMTGDTSNKENKFTYYNDIWQKTSGRWKLKSDNSFYNTENSDLFGFSKLDIKSNYYIKHGYLYIIKPFPIDLVKKYFGKSYSKFENEMNNYYVENDLQYTCFIYKYVP